MPGRRSFLRRAFGAAAGLVALPFGDRAVGAVLYEAGGGNWEQGIGLIGLPRKPLAYGTCYDGKGYIDAAHAVIARIERYRLDALAGSDPCDPWPEAA